MSKYSIGIDLGTTNTVVSYRKAGSDGSELLSIPQRMQDGSVQHFNFLPSAIYLVADDEKAALCQGVPWSSLENEGFIVGKGALELGQRRADQLVQSAKSWLSHRLVDRREGILPWGSDAKRKISPLKATELILRYVHDVWCHQFPDALMSEQRIALTLPASFDEQARSLTLEAAEKAGVGHPYLLEEPQAACYHYLAGQNDTALPIDSASSQLRLGKMLLVVDIGGGTTDFSLVKIRQPGADKIALQRVAVGEHLLLGGDNLDQALAYQLDPRQIAALSASRLASVVQQTRLAKEMLLGENGPDDVTLTVLGGGSRLIGGSQKFAVQKAALIDQLENGFLPKCTMMDRPSRQQYAVHSMGLPYEHDAAFTHHLAEFLGEHEHQIMSVCGAPVPDMVLFNGGLFNSPIVESRLLSLLSDWRGSPVTLCRYDAPNQGVAFGAVQYLLALDGVGVRIESGAPHHLLLKMGAGEFVTLIPKGTLSGDVVELPNTFVADAAREVQFPLFRANDRHQLGVGDVVAPDAEGVHFISTLVSTLDERARSKQDVTVSACLTEIGVLQVTLKSLISDQTWDLHFTTTPNKGESETESATLHKNIGQAEELLVKSFTSAGQKADAKAIKNLKVELEAQLGERESWNLPTLRRLFDKLLSLKSGRTKSAAHERLWLQYAGYCLRPGYGDDRDGERVTLLTNTIKQAPKYTESSVYSQYWTCYRRIAGGLSPERQQALYKVFNKYYSPAGQRSRALQKELPQMAGDDLIRLMGSLEQLPLETKSAIALLLSKRLAKSSESDTGWWAIGRICSRKLLDQSAEMIESDTIQRYTQLALKEDWRKRRQAGLAAVLMCQSSTSRADEQNVLLQKVVDKLQKEKCPESWGVRLTQSEPHDDAELASLVGESLPIGLTFK